MHYYQMVDHGDMGINFFMAFIGLLFIILLIVAIFKISADKNPSSPEINREVTQNKPIEIAKERYAKGEISKDEFTQLKKDLTDE